MQELVSVIIPAYNHEKYIKDTIESVLNQTYKNIEVLIEDDCSTDKTKEVIKSIKDKRLKCFYSKKNQGVVDTMNELTKKCGGKYIAVIGSDDIWYPTKIEEQVKLLREKTNVGVVFTLADFIDENGKKYDDDDPMLELFKKDNVSQGKRFRMFYTYGNHLCHPSSLIPKKVIEDIGLYNKGLRQLHDYEYWVRINNKYDIYVINKKLMGYRRARKSNNSISADSEINNVRMYNELFYINYQMIKNMNDNLFKKGFSDLFRNKTSNTKEEILCEKYFVLLDMQYDCYNKNYAYSLLLDYKDTEKIFQVLEKKYKYTLRDFYKDTGKKSKIYPDRVMNKELIDSINEKNQKIEMLTRTVNDMVNSKSWKITKPLRSIRRRMKNEKNEEY